MQPTQSLLFKQLAGNPLTPGTGPMQQDDKKDGEEEDDDDDKYYDDCGDNDDVGDNNKDDIDDEDGKDDHDKDVERSLNRLANIRFYSTKYQTEACHTAGNAIKFL